MNHSVFLNSKNVIEVKVGEIVNVDDALSLGKQVLDLSTKVEDLGLDVKILIDSTDEKEWGAKVMPLLSIIFSQIKFKRGAIFGSHAELAKMQRMVVEKANIADRGRVFETRAEAEEWINSD